MFPQGQRKWKAWSERVNHQIRHELESPVKLTSRKGICNLVLLSWYMKNTYISIRVQAKINRLLQNFVVIQKATQRRENVNSIEIVSVKKDALAAA